MSWENALLIKLSNGVEKYEIEVTKMGQNYSHFFLVLKHQLLIENFLSVQWQCFCSVELRFV